MKSLCPPLADAGLRVIASKLGDCTPPDVEASHYVDLETPETATAALEKH